jgi:hypothetical protein
MGAAPCVAEQAANCKRETLSLVYCGSDPMRVVEPGRASSASCARKRVLKLSSAIVGNGGSGHQVDCETSVSFSVAALKTGRSACSQALPFGLVLT